MVLKLRGRSEKKFSINCKLNAIFVCYTHKYKMIRFSVKSNLRCQLNEWWFSFVFHLHLVARIITFVHLKIVRQLIEKSATMFLAFRNGWIFIHIRFVLRKLIYHLQMSIAQIHHMYCQFESINTNTLDRIELKRTDERIGTKQKNVHNLMWNRECPFRSM